MLGRTDSRRRLIGLLLIVVVGALALVARLAFWQVGQRDFLIDQAASQTSVRVEEPTARGEIYDRTGTVVLATSVARDRLVAAPHGMTREERRATADALIWMLGLDEDAAATLRARLDQKDKSYVILARGIEPAMADRIRTATRDGSITGITLESEPLRVYPQPGGGPELDPGRPPPRASSTARARASTASSSTTRRPWVGRPGSPCRDATRAGRPSRAPPTWSPRARPARTSASRSMPDCSSPWSRSCSPPGSRTRPRACRPS